VAILCDKEWNTDGWVGKERMFDPPNWFGVSPELLAHRGRPWNQDYSDGPWLDHEGAEAKIEERLTQGRITSQEAELLSQWVEHGYFILEHAIDESDFGLIDEYVRDLDGLWTTDEELPGLQVMSLHIKGRPPGPVDHAELLSWPLEKRLELRDSQLWRIHYYHPHTRAGLELTKAKKLLRMCELLLDDDPVLINAIGFKWGSQVGLHQDLCAYHIHPANRLIGIWLAGEDVNPDSGPLGVYPGSHRVPLWEGWNNYPQTCLRTCHLETRDAQARYLEAAVVGLERKPLPVKKGDAIFQHPLLIHGGDKIKDTTATRFSMVLHFSIPGGDKMHAVEGPFNW
jgi:Phytanoyl-CoA dioxygenase (PhyH)